MMNLKRDPGEFDRVRMSLWPTQENLRTFVKLHSHVSMWMGKSMKKTKNKNLSPHLGNRT